MAVFFQDAPVLDQIIYVIPGRVTGRQPYRVLQFPYHWRDLEIPPVIVDCIEDTITGCSVQNVSRQIVHNPKGENLEGILGLL
jgi:hypothetical protein